MASCRHLPSDPEFLLEYTEAFQAMTSSTAILTTRKACTVALLLITTGKACAVPRLRGSQDFEKVNPGTAMLREANRLLNKDEYARKSVQDTKRA